MTSSPEEARICARLRTVGRRPAIKNATALGTKTSVVSGQEPKAAVILYFDGPMNPPVVEVARRAGRNRVIPAISRHPVLIGGSHLRQSEARASAAVTPAVSLDALDESRKVVNFIELLPGEDPPCSLAQTAPSCPVS
jgi:hypothetical protein